MKTLKEVTIGGNLYTIRANEVKESDYAVEMEVFRSVGEGLFMGVLADPPIKYYIRKDASTPVDMTDDLDKAECALYCFIKWDGCSDIHFSPDHEGNEHFCGKKDAMSLGLVIGECYEFARDLLASKIDEGMFE